MENNLTLTGRWTLSQRLQALGMSVPEARKVGKLRRRSIQYQNETIIAWVKVAFKEDGSTLYNLYHVPSVPDTHTQKEAIKAYLDAWWKALTPQERQQYAARTGDLLARGITCLLEIFGDEFPAAYWPMVIEVRQGTLSDQDEQPLRFPPAEQRHPAYAQLDLDDLVKNYNATKLAKLTGCHNHVGQDIFDFHAYPLICQKLGKQRVDGAVADFAEKTWNSLSSQEEWEAISREFRGLMGEGEPRGLFIVLEGDNSTNQWHMKALSHIQEYGRKNGFPRAQNDFRATENPSVCPGAHSARRYSRLNQEQEKQDDDEEIQEIDRAQFVRETARQSDSDEIQEIDRAEFLGEK